MKNQALFSSKDKRKKLKCRLLQFLFGALRVKSVFSLAISCAKKTCLKAKQTAFRDQMRSLVNPLMLSST